MIENLYSSQNGISINISAVVGKNGTGKSTIIELLYYVIYAICTKKTINNQLVLNTEHWDLLEQRRKLEIDLKWLNESIAIKRKNKIGEKLSFDQYEFFKSVYREPELTALELLKSHGLALTPKNVKSIDEFCKDVLDKANEHLSQLEWKIRVEEKIEKYLREEFNVSILYEIGEATHEIRYMRGQFKHSKYNPQPQILSTNIDEFSLENFFYTISLNYSHHSLNSRTIGNWINKLFHKNDGYTTPVVINPMRDEGNFDINQELKLSRERLMSNLLYDLVHDKKTSLLNKYHVKKFIFSIKRPIKSVSIETDDKQNFSELRSSFLFDKLKFDQIDAPIYWWNYAVAYMERKLNRIDMNYRSQIYKDVDTSIDPEIRFRDFIKTDKSHITKKIKQVCNFLEKTFVQENRNFWNPLENEVQIDFDKVKMNDWLRLFSDDLATLSPSELIEFGLPGFFNIDFLLGDDSGSEIVFSKLSSGEQQMILNTNSILYHLYNLQSVHANGKNENLSRVAYKNINIVLDEIELYYHPEMQRTLVSELVNGLDRIKKQDDGIEAINLCILTHSPFILSDIPNSNILYLKCEGDKSVPQKIDNQTFSANIHDLLANSFFLDNGFMGEFAKKKINSAIEYLQSTINNRKYLNIEKWDKDNVRLFIDSIGEPMLKRSINELYYLAFLTGNENAIKEEIKRLEKLIK